MFDNRKIRKIACILLASTFSSLGPVSALAKAGPDNHPASPASAAASSSSPAPAAAEFTIRADAPGPVVNRQIFTQFAEHLGKGIYEGIWVGPNSSIPNIRGFRKDVIDALRELQVPVVRWPGGCFADEYHWRDGIGPREKRPVKVNTNWGGVTEPNAVGTHEFMDFVELIGAEPYIAGNVGSSPPQEMAEWIEYMTSPTGSSLAKERAKNGHPAPWKVPYIGIGNELWGCGGSMRAEFAADETKRYSTFVKVPEGSKIIKVASGGVDKDLPWTDTMMKLAAPQIDAYSLHYYTFTNNFFDKGSATQFGEKGWMDIMRNALRMDDLITQHSAIMDKYDPSKRIWLAVDEWGSWYDVEPGTNPGFLYQQNTLRDAVLAALNINIFTKHADRVKLTAIAQMVNVLQAMILTDGKRMLRTPTYHVFHMFKPWQEATSLPIEIKAYPLVQDDKRVPAISVSAVRDKAGKVHVALVNLDPVKPMTVTARLAGLAGTGVSGEVLTADEMNAMNTFDQPDKLVPHAYNDASISGSTLRAAIPAKSVVVLELK